MLKKLFLTILLFLPYPAWSEQYQSRNVFLQEAFSQQPPKPQLFWITKPLKKQISDILQHKPRFLRTRYWRKNTLSVWILEEIGKTQPITVGVIIDNNKIVNIKVLTFRESRGWEVKHAFFTNQFKENLLTPSLKLQNRIDGISGATLSVRALDKIARLALLFNQHIQK
jgi:hypothetical protein